MALLSMSEEPRLVKTQGPSQGHLYPLKCRNARTAQLCSQSVARFVRRSSLTQILRKTEDKTKKERKT